MDLLPTTPSITQLATIISQATAPAFLLGALSGFIAILISRLNRLIDRSVSSDPADKGRLKVRALLINRALMWAVISSIATAFLLIVAFGIALFQLPHEYGVAMLFIVALATFALSLVNFAREVRIAVMDFEHFV